MTVDRALAEMMATATEASALRERKRLARILGDHGHVALAVCVEVFDDEGAEVDKCDCFARDDHYYETGRDPRCEVCRGTGERQPTVMV